MCKHFYSLLVSFGLSTNINICTPKKVLLFELTRVRLSVCSFPMKMTKRLACDILDTFATHGYLVISLIQTAGHKTAALMIKSLQLSSLIFNKQALKSSGKTTPCPSSLFHCYHCISKAHHASLVHFPFKLISNRSVAEHTLLSHVKIIPLQPL